MKLYRTLLLFVSTLCIFVNLHAQSFSIDDLKACEWIMDDNPDYSMVFTDSVMITKWIVFGKETISRTEYYMSDNIESDFDNLKVGTIKKGKYIIEEVRYRDKNNNICIRTNSFPLLGITENKLVIEFANKSVYTFHKK